MCAVYPDARNPFTHTELLRDEGLEPHSVPEVWVMAGPEGTTDRFVDVTDTYELKLAAIRSHESQMQEGRDVDAMLRGWLQAQAVRGGLAEGRLAEAFRVVDTA